MMVGSDIAVTGMARRGTSNVPRPDWANASRLSLHFRKHGVALGAATVADYDASARGTIRAGRRFSYRDQNTGETRVGYFDFRTSRLTILNVAETRIVSHFSCRESYVRKLPGSDY